jgi:cell division protein FtsI (penicillin-binding protein 3)
MALITPSNAGAKPFRRGATTRVREQAAEAGPRSGAKRVEQVEPASIRLKRSWLLVPATVLPLLVALAGFTLQQRGFTDLPAMPVEQVVRGRVLASDGTVLAEGAAGDRYYPLGGLAAPLLGFTGALQPDGRYGLEGVEYTLDRTLASGQDVTLTLDPVLQAATESHLAAAALEHSAESGAAIILEVGTGRVLASASYPSYDPNAWQSASRGQMLNRPFQQVYEPGSVIKPLVVAGLLQDGLLSPNELVDAPMTLLSVPDVLAYSSNSAMIALGSRFQPAQLHDWMWRFGLGHGVDQASASSRSGILNDWATWVPQDQASNSIGQNLSVTPLQIAAAYSIFANDGVYVPPTVVEGEALPAPHRVLAPEIAQAIRSMLSHVMDTGGLRQSRIPGMSVGGKTGTADVYDPVAGTYPPDDYALTFAGMFPVEKPKVVVVVMLMKPQGDSTSTYVAAPIFRAIGSEVVAHWGVAPAAEAVAQAR